ncbi:MAG TPA: thiamine pyrophosphate-dependent enzyme [bacterium]
MAANSVTGGQALVECLRREGVKHVFSVPGESYLGALDAFYDASDITLITNRQEGGACFMAESYAKATREVGVCFVTRGPGATNASIGVHCADQDSTPLVLFVGQVPRANRGREAFQEVDYERFFGSMAKWVVEIGNAGQIAETVPRAFHMARSGRPGPVVVSLPEDILVEMTDAKFRDPYPRTAPNPDPKAIQTLAERITSAKKPVMIVGGGVQFSRARQPLVRVSEQFALPVVTSWRRMDAFPNTHPNYAGNLSSAKSSAQDLVKEADLVVVVGDRLSEMTTMDYHLFPAGQPLAQVDIDARVIGRNFSPQLAVVSDARKALEALLEHAPKATDSARRGWIDTEHKKFMQTSTPLERPSKKTSADRVMKDINALVPKDTIFTVDAGNFSAWIHRFVRYDAEDSFFGPTVGSMGYGIPSAIGAKLAHPNRVVIGTCGDGGFMMTLQELATAVQYNIQVIQLVFNNGTYGTIRMHQERDYPGRTIGTDMVNPDFAALARSFGAEGLTVKTSDEFAPALKQALACGKPAVIDILTDMEQISIAATISDLRAGKGTKRRAS